MPETPKEDIDARLAAARLRLASRAEADEQRRKLAELEALEMKLRDAETLDEARAKYGAKNIAAVGYAEGLCVIKRGLPVDFSRWDASKKDEADNLEFISQLLVFPTRDELDKVLERYPLVLTALTVEGMALYGFRRREIEGN